MDAEEMAQERTRKAIKRLADAMVDVGVRPGAIVCAMIAYVTDLAIFNKKSREEFLEMAGAEWDVAAAMAAEEPK